MRLSPQVRRVLAALLEHPAQPLCGAGIGRCTGLASGTLYPLLLQLERAGWLVSRWEATGPGSAGPRRRLYRLTPDGDARAAAAADRFIAALPAT